MSLQDLRNNNTTNFDPTVTHDDFLNQLLYGFQPAADDENISTLNLDVNHFEDQSAFLSSMLRQHQITAAAAGGRTASSALKSLQLPRGLTSAGETAFFQNDNVDESSFLSPIEDNRSIQNLFHGFTSSLTSNQNQQFRNLSPQNFESPGPVMSQVRTGSVTAGAPSQPRQRVRARRGQATDPHSIAERLRRERIAERMKALQEIVPNTNKTDKASMLDDIIDYVKFLQLQVKLLSMSRLGGASGTAEGRVGRRSNNNETTTVTENQVVKLLEQDMGAAMQYLQGKGLCLMPISLATTMSATRNNHPLGGGDGGGPSSPNMSVSTVQSANGVSVKDSP